jgi:hypothetical protein
VPIGTIGIRAGVPIDVATIPSSCSNCERWRRDKDGVPLLDRQPVHCLSWRRGKGNASRYTMVPISVIG